MIDFNEQSKKLLEIILSKHFPKRIQPSISDVEEISGGWETNIFSLRIHSKVSGAHTSDNLILRFFPGTNGATQAQKEFLVMQRLRELVLPVPKVELLVSENSPFGMPFIVMEKILGHTLANELQGASEEKIIHWIRSSAALLHQLHQIPWQEVIRNNSVHESMEKDPLAHVNSKLTDMIRTINRFQLIEFEPFLHWLQERVEYGASTELCLMHNDFHPQNLMLSPNNDQLTILDWSFAEIGDYRLELAWSVLLYGVQIGEEYRAPLLQTYEQYWGRPIDHFEYFEVLKFTDRMLTIATWLDERVTIPVEKITKDALRGDYKIHVLNVYRRLKQILGFSLPTIENL